MDSFLTVSVPTPIAFVFLSTLLAICITILSALKKKICILVSFLGFRSNAADVSVLLGCGDSLLYD